MRVLKNFYVYLVIIALLMPTASAHDHPQIEGNKTVPIVSAWAKTEVSRAEKLGLIPEYGLPQDYSVPITREAFTVVSMQYVAVQSHCDSTMLKNMADMYLAQHDETGNIKPVFSDANWETSLAYYLGIVQGRGDGTFDPEGQITREEAAVMLTRAYEGIGGSLPNQAEQLKYSDHEKIADWAKESVSALTEWHVMEGFEDASFSPNGIYSVEQCIITFLRLYDNAPISRKNGNAIPLFNYEQGIHYLEHNYDGATRTESLRIDGPVATLIRTELRGTPSDGSGLYFIYHSGGVRIVDLGICNGIFFSVTSSLPLEDPQFSEDGKTFTCTLTLSNDNVSCFTPSGQPLHEMGIYHVTIDVDTGMYQLQFEAPSQVDSEAKDKGTVPPS